MSPQPSFIYKAVTISNCYSHIFLNQNFSDIGGNAPSKEGGCFYFQEMLIDGQHDFLPGESRHVPDVDSQIPLPLDPSCNWQQERRPHALQEPQQLKQTEQDIFW